eukprot:TRINITY_DN24455_c0_g1_i1.p1 TRINITY_DN24455_c0_g1~~TRINITY_DN24455_c0_g1_i1.p1  ORF type:complete len:132 (-),score=21.99 TRINITY_DN24455_c0_g1_i1:127-522(-)
MPLQEAKLEQLIKMHQDLLQQLIMIEVQQDDLISRVGDGVVLSYDPEELHSLRSRVDIRFARIEKTVDKLLQEFNIRLPNNFESASAAAPRASSEPKDIPISSSDIVFDDNEDKKSPPKKVNQDEIRLEFS